MNVVRHRFLAKTQNANDGAAGKTTGLAESVFECFSNRSFNEKTVFFLKELFLFHNSTFGNSGEHSSGSKADGSSHAGKISSSPNFSTTGSVPVSPTSAVAEDSLNSIRLPTWEETDDLYRAATIGTLH
ncbi:MAG: hypothetical protein P8J33_00780 [Pirellulaceae bacterium]|nr:hypothetical protein [Pirellulaceae bacterium]